MSRNIYPPVAKIPTPKEYKIFCLETEWSHSEEDIKDKSAVLPLLEFIENGHILNAKFLHRQVATYWDFKYYFEKLKLDSFEDYNLVYLCFHGSPGRLQFADGKHTTLTGIGRDFPNIFFGKYIHFDSCMTMNVDIDKVREFKYKTKAQLVSGFTKTVGFVQSFMFELWLFSVYMKGHVKNAEELNELAAKEMSYWVDQLGFVAF